jgi:hypothetical protein
MSRPIEETVRLLESLVESQGNALEIAKTIMSNKDKLIKLCEQETEIYKKENKRLIRGYFLLLSIIVIQAILILI